MNNLIQNLVEIHAFDHPIKKKRCTVAELCNPIFSLVDHLNFTKHHFIQYHCDFDLVINASKVVLQQILLNLIANAIKFTPSNGNIQISIQKRLHTIYFSVKDNGLGIPLTDHHKIFEKYSRLHPEIDGTGIGLSLAKKLVERIGGIIGFQSEQDKGALFFFEIPYET